MPSDALFQRSGTSGFVPTEAAVGPWDPQLVHGAAVAALFAGRLAPTEATLARLTIEIVAPVPLSPLTYTYSQPTGGARVQRQHATLMADDRTVASATSVAVRRGTLDMPPEALHHDSPFKAAAPPSHRQPDPRVADAIGWMSFDSRAVVTERMRTPDDERIHQWVTLATPVVEGTTIRGVEIAAVAADYAQSAVQTRLRHDVWSFRNTELTLHLSREPVGPWIGMRCESVVQPVGTGFNTADLFDGNGWVARSTSALVIERRAG